MANEIATINIRPRTGANSSKFDLTYADAGTKGDTWEFDAAFLKAEAWAKDYELLEAWSGTALKRESAEERTTKLGKQLYEAIFQNCPRPSLKDDLPRYKLRLLLDLPSELEDVPWEILCADTCNGPFFFAREIGVSRLSSVELPAPRRSIGDPPQPMLIYASAPQISGRTLSPLDERDLRTGRLVRNPARRFHEVYTDLVSSGINKRLGKPDLFLFYGLGIKGTLLFQKHSDRVSTGVHVAHSTLEADFATKQYESPYPALHVCLLLSCWSVNKPDVGKSALESIMTGAKCPIGIGVRGEIAPDLLKSFAKEFFQEWKRRPAIDQVVASIRRKIDNEGMDGSWQWWKIVLYSARRDLIAQFPSQS